VQQRKLHVVKDGGFVSERYGEWWRVALALGLLMGLATVAHAVPCAVPSASYPTIGAAVRDGACTLVQLAAGSFPENVVITRDLALAGAGAAATSLHGSFIVSGTGNEVILEALTVDGTAVGVAGCWREVLSATGGATIAAGADLRVLNTAAGGTACRLFADGFESGGTSAWSAKED
jgi:hypothetical protein